ncbi:Uncharacterized protein TCM_027071 [Theobroma cacao]|uniref:F-box domain-containing protein n=1 Tax=Theobroma cacao TaxID=3641 RepID=A0A061G784_THECC|nr:Uncharacterized protein TCM_027071 [Theobroma cacao]
MAPAMKEKKIVLLPDDVIIEIMARLPPKSIVLVTVYYAIVVSRKNFYLMESKYKCSCRNYPSLFHLFSTTDSNCPGNSSSSDNPSSLSSYLSNMKAAVKQYQKERLAAPFSRNRTNPSVPASKPILTSASSEEIRKNLSKFRRRPAVPPPTDASATPSQSQPPISLQELYKRCGSLTEKETESPTHGVDFKDLREGLSRLMMSEDEKQRRTSRKDCLGVAGPMACAFQTIKPLLIKFSDSYEALNYTANLTDLKAEIFHVLFVLEERLGWLFWIPSKQNNKVTKFIGGNNFTIAWRTSGALLQLGKALANME